jgi:hypothetical protein
MDYAPSTALTWTGNLDGLAPSGELDQDPPQGEFEDRVGPQSTGMETREEDLVADARAGLTPAQMVEHKLVFLLKSTPLPVSQLMTRSHIRYRFEETRLEDDKVTR